jgi:hypothetical protein
MICPCCKKDVLYLIDGRCRTCGPVPQPPPTPKPKKPHRPWGTPPHYFVVRTGRRYKQWIGGQWGPRSTAKRYKSMALAARACAGEAVVEYA